MQKTSKNEVYTPEIYGTKHCFLTSKTRPKKGVDQNFQILQNLEFLQIFVKFLDDTVVQMW